MTNIPYKLFVYVLVLLVSALQSTRELLLVIAASDIQNQ